MFSPEGDIDVEYWGTAEAILAHREAQGLPGYAEGDGAGALGPGPPAGKGIPIVKRGEGIHVGGVEDDEGIKVLGAFIGPDDWVSRQLVRQVEKLLARHAPVRDYSEYDLQSALKLMRGKSAPAVRLTSAREGTGLKELWDAVRERADAERASGVFHRRREDQRARWMRQLVEEALLRELHTHPAVLAAWPGEESAVRSGERTAAAAARILLERFRTER